MHRILKKKSIIVVFIKYTENDHPLKWMFGQYLVKSGQYTDQWHILKFDYTILWKQIKTNKINTFKL